MDNQWITHVTDLMQSIGPVTSKKMFGGAGLYLDGVIFALIANNELYLKTDALTVKDFENEGLESFVYHKQSKAIHLSYYQAPEEFFENQEVLIKWANKAYQAALRNAHKTKLSKKQKKTNEKA